MARFPTYRITAKEEVSLGLQRLAAEKAIADAIGSTPAGVSLIASLLRKLQARRIDMSSIMPGLRGYSGSKRGGRPRRDPLEYGKKYASLEEKFQKAVGFYVEDLNISWQAAACRFSGIGMLPKIVIGSIADLSAMVVDGNDVVTASINGLSFSQPLDQARALLVAAQAQKTKYDEIRNTFVCANVGLVLANAERFYPRSAADRDDIIQEAMVGLMHAVEMWDPKRGIKFGTYATPWIKQYCTRYLDSACAGNISIPVWRAEQRRTIARKYWTMLARTGTSNNRDIANEAGISEAEMKDTLQAYLLQGPSLNDRFMFKGKRERDIQSFLATEEDVENDVIRLDIRSKAIRLLLSGLTTTEERIIRARYGLDGKEEQSLQEIGDKIKRSRERVRQIEAQALAKMRASKQTKLIKFKREVCL